MYESICISLPEDGLRRCNLVGGVRSIISIAPSKKPTNHYTRKTQ